MGIYRVIGFIGIGKSPDKMELGVVQESDRLGTRAVGADRNPDSIECSVALTDVFGHIETLMEKTTNLTKNYLTQKNLKIKSGDMGLLPEAHRTTLDSSLSERAVSLSELLDKLNKLDTRLDALSCLPEPPEPLDEGVVARSTTLWGCLERHNALKVKKDISQELSEVNLFFEDHLGLITIRKDQNNEHIFALSKEAINGDCSS